MHALNGNIRTWDEVMAEISKHNIHFLGLESCTPWQKIICLMICLKYDADYVFVTNNIIKNDKLIRSPEMKAKKAVLYYLSDYHPYSKPNIHEREREVVKVAKTLLPKALQSIDTKMIETSFEPINYIARESKKIKRSEVIKYTWIEKTVPPLLYLVDELNLMYSLNKIIGYKPEIYYKKLWALSKGDKSFKLYLAEFYSAIISPKVRNDVYKKSKRVRYAIHLTRRPIMCDKLSTHPDKAPYLAEYPKEGLIVVFTKDLSFVVPKDYRVGNTVYNPSNVSSVSDFHYSVNYYLARSANINNSQTNREKRLCQMIVNSNEYNTILKFVQNLTKGKRKKIYEKSLQHVRSIGYSYKTLKIDLLEKNSESESKSEDDSIIAKFRDISLRTIQKRSKYKIISYREHPKTFADYSFDIPKKSLNETSILHDSTPDIELIYENSNIKVPVLVATPIQTIPRKLDIENTSFLNFEDAGVYKTVVRGGKLVTVKVKPAPVKKTVKKGTPEVKKVEPIKKAPKPIKIENPQITIEKIEKKIEPVIDTEIIVVDDGVFFNFKKALQLFSQRKELIKEFFRHCKDPSIVSICEATFKEKSAINIIKQIEIYMTTIGDESLQAQNKRKRCLHSIKN